MFGEVMLILTAALLLIVFVVAMPFMLAQTLIAGARLGGRVKAGLGAAVLAIVCLMVWEYLHPSDELYLNSFTEMTQRPLPPSARIVHRKSDIDHIRGRSCIGAHFETSGADYAALLGAIRADAGLVPGAGPQVHFTRPPSEGISYSRSLIFLDDGKTVAVDFCT